MAEALCPVNEIVLFFGRSEVKFKLVFSWLLIRNPRGHNRFSTGVEGFSSSVELKASWPQQNIFHLKAQAKNLLAEAWALACQSESPQAMA